MDGEERREGSCPCIKGAGAGSLLNPQVLGGGELPAPGTSRRGRSKGRGHPLNWAERFPRTVSVRQELPPMNSKAGGCGAYGER